MPGVDGVTVLLQVRQTPSSMVCIMMTAWTGCWPRHELIDAGADDVLAKPFDLDIFLACVARNLDERLRATA